MKIMKIMKIINTMNAQTIRLAWLIAFSFCNVHAASPAPDGDASAAEAVPGATMPAVSAQVLQTYADIAAAVYADSVTQARELHQRILEFTVAPDEEKLRSARLAWLAARVPYQQSEVFRFGNAVVDSWEGKVNAWPIDEGFLDYVAGDAYNQAGEKNPLYAANLVASERILVDGRIVDASRVDAELLAQVLHEAGGIETNIATGYHVVEFLLWGQDLNPEGARMSAGRRPAADYDTDACSSAGHCRRRAQLLRTVATVLVDDLADMARWWAPGGQARAALELPTIYTVVLTGIEELAYAELAGERMRLGLVLHDQEEEHDCFSDNTHNSHFYNVVGIENVYLGRYQRTDGSMVKGVGLSKAVAAYDKNKDRQMRKHINQSRKAMTALVHSAESGQPYDWLIDNDNPEGNALVQAGIDSLAQLAESAAQIKTDLAR